MKLRLKLNNDNDIYYNSNKVYSYDFALAQITGGRGIGKTTTFLIKAIQNVNKGDEFIYLRRYKPELKKFVNKGTLATVCDEVSAKGDGSGGFVFFAEDTICGYGIPLSTAISYKSTDFSKVTLIIYDEYTLPPGPYHYLQDEHELFLDFVSTVSRTRKNVKVVMLGNNVDMFNPHLRYYNVPANIDGIWYDKQRKLYVEFAKNSPKLLEMEQDTPLYNLTKGTSYHDYHYNNKVLGAPKLRIGNPPLQQSLFCRLTVDNNTLNIGHYRDKQGNLLLYAGRKERVYKDDYTYVLSNAGVTNNFYLSMFKSKLQKYLEKFFFNDMITYSDELAANIMNWVINRI